MQEKVAGLHYQTGSAVNHQTKCNNKDRVRKRKWEMGY